MKPENPRDYLALGLRRAVTDSGLPIDAIAAGTNITGDHLTALMAGKVSPRQETLVALAETLGCPISEIYAHGEAAVDGGLTLTLCYTEPSWRADVVSKAALGISLRKAQREKVLFLSWVQSSDWIVANLARFEPPEGLSFSTSLELPTLVDECRPDVVVVDNLARLHPEQPTEPTLAWFREADRRSLRRIREALEGLHRLDVYVVHFVSRDDALKLQEEGFVNRVVSIESEFLSPRSERPVRHRGEVAPSSASAILDRLEADLAPAEDVEEMEPVALTRKYLAVSEAVTRAVDECLSGIQHEDVRDQLADSLSDMLNRVSRMHSDLALRFVSADQEAILKWPYLFCGDSRSLCTLILHRLYTDPALTRLGSDLMGELGMLYFKKFQEDGLVTEAEAEAHSRAVRARRYDEPLYDRESEADPEVTE